MQNKTKRALTLPLRLAVIIIIFGALFKVMHWPYGQQLILIGNSILLVLYVIRFLLKTKKVKPDYIKLALVVLWVFSYFNQITHLLNSPYLFEIILPVLFIWWLIEEGFTYVTDRKLRENKILKTVYYTLIGITFVLIVFGIMFKIMHWPYGNIAFTFGILLLNLMLIIDYFMIKR